MVETEGLSAMKEYDQFFSVFPTRYSLFHVTENSLGFSETGIVSSVSKRLGAAQISIFYQSSFSTDYFLVPETDVENAVESLKEHFILTERNGDEDEE